MEFRCIQLSDLEMEKAWTLGLSCNDAFEIIDRYCYGYTSQGEVFYQYDQVDAFAKSQRTGLINLEQFEMLCLSLGFAYDSDQLTVRAGLAEYAKSLYPVGQFFRPRVQNRNTNKFWTKPPFEGTGAIITNDVHEFFSQFSLSN